MEKSEVAIIIPAYNEDKTISDVIKGVRNFGEVIVVNDNSNDNTVSVAESSGAIVCSHEDNGGYDAALTTGFKKAKDLNKNFIITIDADGQHSFKDVARFLEELKRGSNLVFGIRPESARFGESMFRFYFRLRFGVEDILCGMKGYNLHELYINKQFDNINSIGTEVSLLNLKRKVNFTQINISISPRLDQPRFGNIFKANIKILRALARIILLDITTK